MERAYLIYQTDFISVLYISLIAYKDFLSEGLLQLKYQLHWFRLYIVRKFSFLFMQLLLFIVQIIFLMPPFLYLI